MYDYGNYLKLITSHLGQKVVMEGQTVEIFNTFTNKFIAYPLKSPTITVGWKNLDFVPSSTSLSGTVCLQLNIYTIRDWGVNEHLNLINQVIDALCNFSDFPISEFSLSSPSYDRTVSALKSSILLTTSFTN